MRREAHFEEERTLESGAPAHTLAPLRRCLLQHPVYQLVHDLPSLHELLEAQKFFLWASLHARNRANLASSHLLEFARLLEVAELSAPVGLAKEMVRMSRGTPVVGEEATGAQSQFVVQTTAHCAQSPLHALAAFAAGTREPLVPEGFRARAAGLLGVVSPRMSARWRLLNEPLVCGTSVLAKSLEDARPADQRQSAAAWSMVVSAAKGALLARVHLLDAVAVTLASQRWGGPPRSAAPAAKPGAGGQR